MLTDYFKFSAVDLLPALNQEDRIARQKARMPVRPPSFTPGTLVYVPVRAANMPLLSVTWDNGPGAISQWLGSVPGYSHSMTNFQEARANAPTLRFEPDGEDSWREVERCEPALPGGVQIKGD